MNSSIKISELKNRYYAFYLSNGNPKILKKNSKEELSKSLERLRENGIDAFLLVDLLTLDVFSHNYMEVSINESLPTPYMIITRFIDKIKFYNVDGRPYYDEPVALSTENFVLINRREKKYIKSINLEAITALQKRIESAKQSKINISDK